MDKISRFKIIFIIKNIFYIIIYTAPSYPFH